MEQGEKICFVVSLPGTARAFLRYHIAELSKRYSVSLVANFKDIDEFELPGVTHYENIGIERRVSPIKDLWAIIRLAQYLRKGSFYSVHSVTPKAGFITSIAAWLAGITCRIHIFTGQVWANKTGLRRSLLKFAH